MSNPSTDKSRKRADALFGRIAMRLNIVGREQIEEALRKQSEAAEHKPLGMILMELNHVTQEDLEKILDAQRKINEAATRRSKAIREDNLFGKVALRLRFCTEAQLRECLDLQDQLPPDRFLRLGDLMVRKGYLTRNHVREILETQRGLILHCSGCQTKYNTLMFRPGASLQCYKCGAAMRIPIPEVTFHEGASGKRPPVEQPRNRG